MLTALADLNPALTQILASPRAPALSVRVDEDFRC